MTVDLHNRENILRPSFCALWTEHLLGANIINLINSFYVFPQKSSSDWLCSGRWCHIFMKTQRNQKPRCYFLSAVVLCIFLVCVVWMKGNFVDNIPSPAAPWLSKPSHLIQVDLCCIHFFQRCCLHVISLHINSQIGAAWRHMLSPASADCTNKNCVRHLYQMLE